MPKLTVSRNTEYHETFRTAKIAGMFDVAVQDKLTRSWDVDIPCEERDWNIGLIVGPSGCGKTTIGKVAFGEENYHQGYDWGQSAFIDSFPQSLSVKDITEALSHVGFSSPPAWLLPFDALSNGQKFRTELARVLLDEREIVVVDEFTSVVDRTVAKIGCAAVNKAIKRKNKKMVAISCHYDITEWLEPDWVYEVVNNQFTWRSLRRPEIRLEVFKCHRKIWDIFKGHHYLSADISPAAQVFVAFYEGEPVAMAATLPFPHGKIRNGYREHRTVVLPDYQGIGIGNRLSELVAQYYIDQGKRYFSTTSHPAMIHHRAKSTKWIMRRKPSNATGVHTKLKELNKTTGKNRLTAGFEYIGEKPHDK